jgi:ABC-2 type transport system permease protein
MSTTSNTTSQPQTASGAKVLPATRPLYWSIRRELWENRSLYIAPAIAALVFLVGFVIHTILLRNGMHSSNPREQQQVFFDSYDMAATLIMGIAFLVGIFYSLDAFYGERRDRSILFWKSLPVSDLTTLLAKVTIPIVVLPLLSFVIALITQLLMLLFSSIIMIGSGVSVATVWQHTSFLRFSGLLLYHIVTVHGLWYAPFYGWLLMVSAWAPRAPFIWAFLPPFVVCGVEKLAFNTMYFLNMLGRRLAGPELVTPQPGSSMMDIMAAVTPLKFFSTPGLWIGLAIAVVFLAVALRLRRYRGPI